MEAFSLLRTLQTSAYQPARHGDIPSHAAAMDLESDINDASQSKRSDNKVRAPSAQSRPAFLSVGLSD